MLDGIREFSFKRQQIKENWSHGTKLCIQFWYNMNILVTTCLYRNSILEWYRV